MDMETAREINELRAQVERERADRIRGEADIRRALAHDLDELRVSLPVCCRPVGMV